MKDVMRVDHGDRRDVILLAGANAEVRGRRLSAHRSFRIGNTVVRLCDPARSFSKNLSRALRSEFARDRAEHAGQLLAPWWSEGDSNSWSLSRGYGEVGRAIRPAKTRDRTMGMSARRWTTESGFTATHSQLSSKG